MPGLRGNPAVMTTMSEFAVGAVIIRAGDADVVAFHRPGLQNVQPLALRNALHDVHQNNVRQLFSGDTQRAIRADVAGSHNSDFFSHRIFKVGQARCACQDKPFERRNFESLL